MSAVGTVALGFSSLEHPQQGRGDDTTLTADARHVPRKLSATHRDASFAPAESNTFEGVCSRGQAPDETLRVTVPAQLCAAHPVVLAAGRRERLAMLSVLRRRALLVLQGLAADAVWRGHEVRDRPGCSWRVGEVDVIIGARDRGSLHDQAAAPTCVPAHGDSRSPPSPSPRHSLLVPDVPGQQRRARSHPCAMGRSHEREDHQAVVREAGRRGSWRKPPQRGMACIGVVVTEGQA